LEDDSDVYVYYGICGGLSCRMNGAKTFNAQDEVEMIAHLERHKAAGHRVPVDAFEAMRS
jgi:hypothetical protein